MDFFHRSMWQLQLWDDMPLNSPKRRRIGILLLVSISTISPQSTCHSASVCEILSKSDRPLQKKIKSCRFSRWRISAILDFRDLIMGPLKSRCTTSYRSSIDTIRCSQKLSNLELWTIALNCLSYGVYFGDTD